FIGAFPRFRRLPIERQEGEPALDVVTQTGAEDPAQKAVERPAAADSGVVVDDLGDAVRRDRLYGLCDPHPIADLVGIGQGLPGAVVTNHDAFQGSLSPLRTARMTSPA